MGGLFDSGSSERRLATAADQSLLLLF